MPVTVTEPAAFLMVKVLEKSSFTRPVGDVVKLPDSVKVPGKGPAAVPLTEKLKLPSVRLMRSSGQVPVNVDPVTLSTYEGLARQRGGRGSVRLDRTKSEHPQDQTPQSAANTERAARPP